MLVAFSVLLAVAGLAQLRCLLLTALGIAWRKDELDCETLSEGEYPRVLVALPVYREETVLDGLLTRVRALTYPKDRLQIAVIDDSQGPEQALAQGICQRHMAEDERVRYLHRPHRFGYKSGALNYADAHLGGGHELVAIFDADFIPEPRFLLETVAAFEAPNVAAVQCRWSYRNARAPLTLLQAAIFESVFCFECRVRRHLGIPALFMGTGGIWRRTVIEELGGWREEPFTAEDLDLSYRATNAGYTIRYVHAALSSCEATETFVALKNQQRRWARGIFQACLDNAPGASKAPHGPSALLLDASVLALQISLPLVLLLQAWVACNVLVGVPAGGSWLVAQIVLSALLLLPPVGVQLFASQCLLHDNWAQRLGWLVRAVPLSYGLSVSVWLGFLDVVARSKQEFVRTPKQGGQGLISGTKSVWLRTGYLGAGLETLLAALGLAATAMAIHSGNVASLVPVGSLAVGGAGAAAASFRELRAKRRNESLPARVVTSDFKAPTSH